MTENIRVIVKYKKETDVSSKTKATKQLKTSLNASVVHTHSSINAVTITIPKNKLKDLKKDPNIEYVEETSPKDVTVLGFKSDTDLTPALQKSIALTQSIPWGITKIRATEVQQGGNEGEEIKVCVEDTGVDYNHEDLKDNYKGGYNFVSNNNNPMDDYGHGTHVAGTIAAIDNDIGVIGVAPKCGIYSVKVLDSQGNGSYDNIVAGIQWCINNGIQVINMSFGGGSYSQALKDICDAAKNRGIVLVAAAGNADGNGSQDTVGYPAKFDSVIAVASTDVNDNRSSFSSCGPAVWVAGPGSNILSTMIKSGPLSNPNGYGYLNGTSMATPHVAGTVTLMLKANTTLSPDNVKNLLGTTAIDLGTSGKDIFFGNGRIDAYAATNGETPPPPKKYSCSGAPNYTCTEDLNGIYNSIEECQAACKAPTAKTYNCSGAPNYQCIEAPEGTTGKYPDLESCQKVCKAPQPTRYSCVNGTCVPDPAGKFPDLATCQAICKPTPPSQNKYMVHAMGTFGAVVTKNPFGSLTSEEACAEVCRILKEIDKTNKQTP